MTKDPRGNKLPFLAVRRKPSGAVKPEGLRPTASFNPVIYFRAAPNGHSLLVTFAVRAKVLRQPLIPTHLSQQL